MPVKHNKDNKHNKVRVTSMYNENQVHMNPRCLSMQVFYVTNEQLWKMGKITQWMNYKIYLPKFYEGVRQDWQSLNLKTKEA